MIALFDAELVVARLQAQVSALKRVAGAAEFAAAMPDVKQLPSAYVIELANRVGPSGTGTLVVSQLNEIRFGVVLAVRNLSDTRGEAAKAALNTLRESVMTALLGWPPEPDYDPCEYGGGRLLQIDNQVLWWQDEYVTSALIRSV